MATAKLTIDQVDATLAKADLYRVGIYINKETNVLAVCVKCNSFVKPRIGNLRQGWGGCKACGHFATKKNLQLDIGKIDQWLSQSSLERIGIYQGNKVPMLCKCLKCNRVVIPTMGSIRAGRGGCIECGHISTAKARSLTLDEVDQALENIEFMRIGLYVNSTTPLLCICLKCNNYTSPAIGNIRRGQLNCFHCAESGYDPKKVGYFYVVAGSEWIKCGISNVPEKRFFTHSRQKLTEVIHCLEFESGTTAMKIEDKWKSYVKTLPQSHRATKNDIPDGHTETVKNTQATQDWIETNLIS